MTMRSVVPLGFQLGYERFSATQIRPRSSKVKPTGWTRLGSPAKRVAVKPSGSLKDLTVSSGVRGSGCCAIVVDAVKNRRSGIRRVLGELRCETAKRLWCFRGDGAG